MVTGISLEQAVALMTGGLSPLPPEALPAVQALGRTLASHVTAPMDHPPFDRSPLDGYALRAADIAGADRNHPVCLPVADTLYAGDEAKSPLLPGQAVRIMTGAMLPPGKIYGSNGALLAARLAELGIPSFCRHAADSPAAVAKAMDEMLEDCHLLITTGGVSVGDKDIFHQALPLLGAERVFWKVDLKPGTPAMFSRHGGKPILSLSGNPFAAFTTFELLARPLLAALAGEPRLLPRQRQAVLTTPYDKPSPRRRFLRGRYEEGQAALPEGHSSGQLASLVGCNCLVELPAGAPPAEAGQAVQVWLL